MAINGAIRVAFDEVFPHGAFVVSEVEDARDWDRSTRDNHVQQLVRDEEGNPVLVEGLEVRVWQVQVMDGDPSVTMAQKMTVVRIASPRRPVAPATPEGQAGAPVELVDMSMRVYPDRKGCRAPRQGEAHFCKARQAFEFWATDLRSPTPAGRQRATAAASNGRGEAG